MDLAVRVAPAAPVPVDVVVQLHLVGEVLQPVAPPSSGVGVRGTPPLWEKISTKPSPSPAVDPAHDPLPVPDRTGLRLSVPPPAVQATCRAAMEARGT